MGLFIPLLSQSRPLHTPATVFAPTHIMSASAPTLGPPDPKHPPVDVEKQAGLPGLQLENPSTTHVSETTAGAETMASYDGPPCNEGEPDLDADTTLNALPPLKHAETHLSTRSAREAARALENFEASPENPRNWPNSRRWRTTLTVAVTGFIATCGSSIAVPGIHASMESFHEPNEKIAVMVTAGYVLGLG